MGVEELRREILEEAERKVSEIIAEARAEARRIIEDAEKKAEEVRRNRELEVRKRMEDKLRSELSLARIDGKKLIINTRWELVDEAFKRAWDRLMEFRETDKYYNEFLPKMIAYGASSMGVNEVRLHLNSDDAKRVKGIVKKLGKDVAKYVGKPIKLSISDNPINIRGGVLISDVEEKVYFNASFEALFNRAKEELAPAVFEILFGGGK